MIKRHIKKIKLNIEAGERIFKNYPKSNAFLRAKSHAIDETYNKANWIVLIFYSAFCLSKLPYSFLIAVAIVLSYVILRVYISNQLKDPYEIKNTHSCFLGTIDKNLKFNF